MNTTFNIGGDLTVNRLGYGAMRLTGQPGNFGPYENWQQGIELVRRAHALGVNFFDSAWAYGPEYADQLVGEALEDMPAVIATKGGVDKPAPGQIVVDGSRDALMRQIDKALINLRVEQIDLFQLHRVDPNTPIEVSMAALAEAQADGRIRHIGLSNIDQVQLDRALAVAPIASVQNRFNSAETTDADLVAYTNARGIAYIPYGPLVPTPCNKVPSLPRLLPLSGCLPTPRTLLLSPAPPQSLTLKKTWPQSLRPKYRKLTERKPLCPFLYKYCSPSLCLHPLPIFLRLIICRSRIRFIRSAQSM